MDASKQIDLSPVDRGLDITDFSGLGRTEDTNKQVDYMKQTMTAMNPEPEEKHKPMDEKELTITGMTRLRLRSTWNHFAHSYACLFRRAREDS